MSEWEGPSDWYLRVGTFGVARKLKQEDHSNVQYGRAQRWEFHCWLKRPALGAFGMAPTLKLMMLLWRSPAEFSVLTYAQTMGVIPLENRPASQSANHPESIPTR